MGWVFGVGGGGRARCVLYANARAYAGGGGVLEGQRGDQNGFGARCMRGICGEEEHLSARRGLGGAGACARAWGCRFGALRRAWGRGRAPTALCYLAAAPLPLRRPCVRRAEFGGAGGQMWARRAFQRPAGRAATRQCFVCAVGSPPAAQAPRPAARRAVFCCHMASQWVCADSTAPHARPCCGCCCCCCPCCWAASSCRSSGAELQRVKPLPPLAPASRLEDEAAAAAAAAAATAAAADDAAPPGVAPQPLPQPLPPLLPMPLPALCRR